LSVKLVACEDYQVGLFRVERTFYERFSVCVRSAITWERWVAARSSPDREMEVSNLHDLEAPIMGEMQGWGAWRD
jgi:hypothetical protein